MPHRCSAVGCTNSSKNGSNARFYRFPADSLHPKKRAKWIRALRRQNPDGTPWEPTVNSRVCSAHFVGGEPSRYQDHPDFTPSVFVYTAPSTAIRALARYSRTTKRRDAKLSLQATRHGGIQNVQHQGSSASPSVSPDSGSAGVPINADEPPAVMDEDVPPVPTDETDCSAGVVEERPEVIPNPKQPSLTNEEVSLLHARIKTLERDVESARQRNELLELELKKSQQNNEGLVKKCLEMCNGTLSLDNVRKGKHFLYYTALTTYKVLHNLCDLVVAKYPEICNGNYMRAQETEEQLFMVLVRLRTGMPCKEIARNFRLSESTLSRTFSRWIFMLKDVLTSNTRFPKLHEVQHYMPACFREFPDTRIVLDTTEVRIQKPSGLEAQRKTFSSYKHSNTMKCLVGITPDCYISFVSNLYGGSTSDRAIVAESGVLDMLECGDAVMVDKGFKVLDLLPVGVKLYIPPYRVAGEKQMSRSDVVCTRKVARARVHVERAIRRIKEFHIFDCPLPLNMADIADEIFTTCALLSNLRGPLIHEAEEAE